MGWTEQHKVEGRHALAPEAVDDDVIGIDRVGEDEWQDEDNDGIEEVSEKAGNEVGKKEGDPTGGRRNDSRSHFRIKTATIF